MRAAGVPDADRIRAVETGACPHGDPRRDRQPHGGGGSWRRTTGSTSSSSSRVGDNLTATFSPALVDAQLFVLDVAGGGDVARKGGPGDRSRDLLVVNKTDLAPHVGVDAERMVQDAASARDDQPVLALSQRDPESVRQLGDWLLRVLETTASGTLRPSDPGPMAPHSHGPGSWYTRTRGARNGIRMPTRTDRRTTRVTAETSRTGRGWSVTPGPSPRA